MTQPHHETETGSIVDIEAIYREHYSRFLRFAVANLGDVEPGREAVHDAFVRAIRSLSDFRGEGRPESWLWRILVNVCTAEKRRRVVPRGCDEAALS
jgi:RNA polymerase sigma-70 factor (ECF subfamily)